MCYVPLQYITLIIREETGLEGLTDKLHKYNLYKMLNGKSTERSGQSKDLSKNRVK
jgi:hypothetical protein